MLLSLTWVKILQVMTEEILNLVLKLPESLCKHYLIIAVLLQ